MSKHLEFGKDFDFNNIARRSTGENMLKSYGLTLVKAENKHDFSADERKKLAESGQAMKDGSYPIRNVQDLKDAIKSIGRAKDPEKVKAWIKKRAAELKAEKELPEKWEEKAMGTGNTPGKETVEKSYDEVYKAASEEVQKKMKKVMDEWKAGKLKSASTGKVVTDQKEAEAIAYSEAGEKKNLKKDDSDGTSLGGAQQQQQAAAAGLEGAGTIDKGKKEALKKSFEALGIDYIEKAEGSRGGKVIGHTKSGKAIYDHFEHKEHGKFTMQDHHDAFIAHADKEYEAGKEKYLDTEKHHHMEAGKHRDAHEEGYKVETSQGKVDLRSDKFSEKHKDKFEKLSSEDHKKLAEAHSKMASETSSADLKGSHSGSAAWHKEQAEKAKK